MGAGTGCQSHRATFAIEAGAHKIGARHLFDIGLDVDCPGLFIHKGNPAGIPHALGHRRRKRSIELVAVNMPIATPITRPEKGAILQPHRVVRYINPAAIT